MNFAKEEIGVGGSIQIYYRSRLSDRDDRIGKEFTRIPIPEDGDLARSRYVTDVMVEKGVIAFAKHHDSSPGNILERGRCEITILNSLFTLNQRMSEESLDKLGLERLYQPSEGE